MRKEKHSFLLLVFCFVGFCVVVSLLWVGVSFKGAPFDSHYRHELSESSDWSQFAAVLTTVPPSNSTPPTAKTTRLPEIQITTATASMDPIMTTATKSPPLTTSTKSLPFPIANATIKSPTETPETSVCIALKHWLEIDCANDPNTLTDDFKVDMEMGSFHSLTALFRKLYPETDNATIDAEVSKRRKRRMKRYVSISNETAAEFQADIDVVRAIHELDSADLLDTFAYYGKEFGELTCHWKDARAVGIANNNIWLPASCTLPFSARLKQGGYSLLPNNWRVVFIGNSYMGQMSSSMFTRSIVRKEAVRGDMRSKNNKDRFLTLYKYRNTGVQHYELKNSLWECLSTETLLRNVMAEMKVEDVNEIDMVVINEGNQMVKKKAKKTCEKHIEETGLERIIDAKGMLQLLETMNYTGLALYTNHKYSHFPGNFTFHFGRPLYHSITCHAGLKEAQCPAGYGHQCAPGHPDWGTEALLTNAYLHLCRQKLVTV